VAPGPVETVNLADFQAEMDINFWGPVRVTQAFLPLLRQCGRGARIIMVTSASIYLTIPVGGSYAIEKHALAALTEHLRMEVAPFGIEVTALEPGGVRTPMTGFRPEQETKLWNTIPQPLRQQYEDAFEYPGKGLSEGFQFESIETYADKVYQQIISAKRLKPRYTLGIGVSVLPWMHRVLSKRALERVFCKLMRVKART
jgi:NAD(P)-dependent dehydrogenase (short-subunit alcohol dehydrogenase family)